MIVLAAAPLLVAAVSGFGAAGVAYRQGRHGWALAMLLVQTVVAFVWFVGLASSVERLAGRKIRDGDDGCD